MTECQRLDGAHTIIPGMLIAIRYTSQEISSKKKALPLTRCCRFDTLTRRRCDAKLQEIFQLKVFF
jgi:hypothetical protein